MSKYQEYSLEELITYISRGITPKYTEEVNNSAIIINPKCIRDFQINFEPSRRNNLTQRIISEEKKVKLFDILINSTGVGTLGRVAQFLDDKIKEIISVDTHVTIVRPDIKKINPLFLGYLVKSKQSEIESFGIGSTGQTELSRDALKSIRFNVPTDRNRQKEIAEFFLQIDQKIQLNTQINQTLEQIAQALFKSWFVDFDPVRAKVQALSGGMSLEQAELAAMQAISGKKTEELTALSQAQPERYAELAETAKAFPCEMVEVDGVEVPKGWTFQYLKDICNIVYGKGLPKTKLTNTGYRVFGANGVIGYYSEFMYKNPQILIGCRGTVGQVTVSTPFSFITNNSLIIEYENSLINRYYLEHYLRTLNLKEISSGSVQLQITIQNMSGVKLLTPNRETLSLYEINVKDIYETMYQNQIENEKLTKVRDLLLPKLLSGEI